MRRRREGLHVWPAFTDLMSGMALLLLVLGLREADRASRLETAKRAAEEKVQLLEGELEEERRKFGVHQQVVERIRRTLESKGITATINEMGNLEIAAEMLFALGEPEIPRELVPQAKVIGSEIIKLLEDPELGDSIEMLMVVGHTDQKGETESNFSLSTQRASELVKLWRSDHQLANRGNELARCIAAKIVAAAMGETRPLIVEERVGGAPNALCENSPEEPQGCRRNRRIELRVVPRDARFKEIEGCD